MPTIGEETYDDTDRVPTRDVRGTAEQARYGGDIREAMKRSTSTWLGLGLGLRLGSGQG